MLTRKMSLRRTVLFRWKDKAIALSGPSLWQEISRYYGNTFVLTIPYQTSCLWLIILLLLVTMVRMVLFEWYVIWFFQLFLMRWKQNIPVTESCTNHTAVQTIVTNGKKNILQAAWYGFDNTLMFALHKMKLHNLRLMFLLWRMYQKLWYRKTIWKK